jgi:hypothetical protein
MSVCRCRLNHVQRICSWFQLRHHAIIITNNVCINCSRQWLVTQQLVSDRPSKHFFVELCSGSFKVCFGSGPWVCTAVYAVVRDEFRTGQGVDRKYCEDGMPSKFLHLRVLSQSAGGGRCEQWGAIHGPYIWHGKTDGLKVTAFLPFNREFRNLWQCRFMFTLRLLDHMAPSLTVTKLHWMTLANSFYIIEDEHWTCHENERSKPRLPWWCVFQAISPQLNC